MRCRWWLTDLVFALAYRFGVGYRRFRGPGGLVFYERMPR